MPVIYPTDGPVLTKRHFVSVVIFRNSLSSIYDFLFSQSSILARHPFTGHSHRLSVTVPTSQTATGQPAASTHTLTQACHSHGMWGMHPPHQRMICIHLVGWASHSGARPQGLTFCETATQPRLANWSAQPCAFWVRGRSTFGPCWWGQTTASNPEFTEAAEVLITLCCGTPKSGGPHNQVYMIMLSRFKGKVLVWSAQERDAFTAGSLTSTEALLGNHLR